MFEIVAAEISPLHTAGCRALGKQSERMQKDVPHGAEMISLHLPYTPLVQTLEMVFQAYCR